MGSIWQKIVTPRRWRGLGDGRVGRDRPGALPFARRRGWVVHATARRAEALDALVAEAAGLEGRIVPAPAT